MDRIVKLAAVLLVALIAAPVVHAKRERVRYDKMDGYAQFEVAVDANPEQIYPYLIEEDLIARWQNDDQLEVSFPNGIEPRVGKQVRIDIDAPTDPWMLMEIVELDPTKGVVTEFIGGVLDGRFAYRLESGGDGVTRVVHEMDIEPVGPLMKFYWVLAGKRLHESKMTRYLANIKEIVEQDLSRVASLQDGAGEAESAIE